MTVEQIISSDPDVQGGTVVFAGTRVPLKNLIDYLEAGDSLEEFLDDFPSVCGTVNTSNRATHAAVVSSYSRRLRIEWSTFVHSLRRRSPLFTRCHRANCESLSSC